MHHFYDNDNNKQALTKQGFRPWNLSGNIHQFVFKKESNQRKKRTWFSFASRVASSLFGKKEV